MHCQCSKFVVGLTGGIGSGKSAASSCFEKYGIDIVDADEVARDVVAAGSCGLSEIAQHFGNHILQEDGSLNRAALREIVFFNPDEKTWLNDLLHPLIRERMLLLIDSTTSPYCILSVPLLVENKLTPLCNRVVVVDCPEEMQRERAMKRDGSTESTINNIMSSQANREERLQAADDVLDNSTSLESLALQVETLHKTLLSQLRRK